jgi:UDP-glucose 4-epimerase
MSRIRRVRAVVTGGAGFIGSHVVDALLARGDEVTVIDDLSTGRREFVNGAARLELHDIREPYAVEADVLFHLAAQADVGTSMERPGYDAEVNVIGTVNTLEAARAVGAEIVFSSTGGAIYGDVQRPAAEDDPRRPVSAYGIAKLAAEAYIEGWNRIHGSGHSVLRFANVYGPRQSAALEGGVVSIFMERLQRGEETLVFGDGEQTRDYVYVGDVVQAVHRVCAEVAGTVQQPRHVEPRAGDARRSVLDPSRAQRDLDWRAETPLDEGLRLTWDSIAG